MNGVKSFSAILKPRCLNPSLLKTVSESIGCIGSRFISSSSESLQSSDVELSYMLYPTNNVTPDPKQVPLIFLHGLFGSKGNLHSVSKHLSSSGRRVVTYDARNHGSSGHINEMDFTSMADDLRDLINELGMGKPSVLGHSMGGKTAMTYALQYPDSLSSLIVADVSPEKSPGLGNLFTYLQAMKKVSIPQTEGLPKARRKVQVQLTPDVPDRNILAFLLTNLIEMEDGSIKWRNNLDALHNNFEMIGDFPSLNAQPFPKPTLFVYGANSQHYIKADQGRIRSLFPLAQIEAIPDAGHFVHAEKPVEFVNVVQEFLKSLESSK